MADLIKLHLGCGSNIMQGWLNCDIGAEGPGVVHIDLRQPLPYIDNIADFAYMEHVIEHFTLADGQLILTQIHRILKPGGVVRISTPSLETLITEYKSPTFRRWKESGWEPKTPAQMINEGMRSWGHEFLYDQQELIRVLLEAGFVEGTVYQWGESRHEALRGIDSRPRENCDLILEARK